MFRKTETCDSVIYICENEIDIKSFVKFLISKIKPKTKKELTDTVELSIGKSYIIISKKFIIVENPKYEILEIIEKFLTKT